MAVKQKVAVIEVTGGPEKLQTAIQTALDGLNPAPVATIVPSITVHGGNGRYVVFIGYVVA